MTDQYIRKPGVVEAIQWSGSNWHEIYAWAGHQVWPATHRMEANSLAVQTPDSIGFAAPGDWVIKNAIGQFFPCHESIFAETYELVRTDETQT